MAGCRYLSWPVVQGDGADFDLGGGCLDMSDCWLKGGGRGTHSRKGLVTAISGRIPGVCGGGDDAGSDLSSPHFLFSLGISPLGCPERTKHELADQARPIAVPPGPAPDRRSRPVALRVPPPISCHK